MWTTSTSNSFIQVSIQLDEQQVFIGYLPTKVSAINLNVSTAIEENDAVSWIFQFLYLDMKKFRAQFLVTLLVYSTMYDIFTYFLCFLADNFFNSLILTNIGRVASLIMPWLISLLSIGSCKCFSSSWSKA